jgi:uncharacterized protein (DUF305 family)
VKHYLSTYPVLVAVLALVAGIGAACNTTSNNNATVVATPTPVTTSTPSMPMSGEMPGMAMKSSPNAASAPYDLQFIDTMSEHHQSAIDMAKIAEMNAQHAEVKSLARSIVADQQKEISQMKSWRDQWYAGKPPAMNMEMPGMMDSMKGMDMSKMKATSGNAFDLMFIDMMTPHHQGAVTMAREALTKSDHPEIKKLAQQIIDAQEKEIALMNKWKAAWSGAK